MEGGRIMISSISFNQKALSLFVVMAVLVFSIVQPVYATPIFGIEKNLSSNLGSSTVPKISTSGNYVYAVWQDITSGNNEIFFANSTDNGATFDPDGPFNLSNTPGSSTAPRIASSGNNVYVVWQEGPAATSEILFRASTNNGASFGSPIPLSITPLTPASVLQITAADSNVYVVWKDDTQIHFAASTNNGASFGSTVNLSPVPANPFLPQVAAVGNNVYVAWHNGTGTAVDILFRSSTNSGASFGTTINLSGTAGVTSNTAQIAAVGNNIYVAWQEGATSDINFKASIDSGANFGSTINLSSNAGASTLAQISAVGNNVYVVWQDLTPGNLEILFKASINNGALFGVENNLSGTGVVSNNAQIAAVGNNVYVAWQEGAAPADISLKSSSNNGASFGGVTPLSSNAGASTIPQISAIGPNVYVLWQDFTPGNSDILFKAGTDTPVEIVFDQSNYRLTDPATVTVTDPSANMNSGLPETITVTMTSTLDSPTGISLTLTETGDATGIFDGSLTFTTTPPSAGTALLAAPGNIITASYGGLTATSNIFTRTVVFYFDTYDLKNIAHITVTDQNSNLDDDEPEIISVHVISTAQPSGIDLILTETGDDSGIFGGPASNLIFMPGDYLIPISSTVTINQHDEDDNDDDFEPDTTTMQITSSSDTPGITLTLTETGDNTNEFSGILSLTTDSSVPGSSIKVAEGDFLTITHKSFFATKGLITPNPNPANGAIQVLLVPDDTVTASYLGASKSAKVTTTDAPGGGGGGISRAGFVVNFIAGAPGGGSGGNSPPSFGTSSFAIIEGGEEGFGGIINDNDAKTVEETKTFKVGQKASLRFDFIEGGGIGNIEHIGLYTNVRDGQKRQDSDAYIYYDPLKS